MNLSHAAIEALQLAWSEGGIRPRAFGIQRRTLDALVKKELAFYDMATGRCVITSSGADWLIDNGYVVELPNGDFELASRVEAQAAPVVAVEAEVEALAIELTETETIALMLLEGQPVSYLKLLSMTDELQSIIDLYLCNYVVCQRGIYYINANGRAALRRMGI